MKETQRNRLKWKKSKKNWLKWKKTESSRWIETTCETVSQIRLALHLSSSQGKVAKCVQNNESTEIPGSHKTSLCRVSEGCKQAIRATFSLPKVAHARQVSFRSDDPVAGRTVFFPCQKTFAHKHWAGTGVLHVGSIPAQPFYLNTDTYRHAQRHRAGFSDKLRGADALSRNYCSSSRIVFFSNLIWIRRWWRWNMCIHWFCCILIKSDFVVKRIPMFYLVTLCFSLFNIESTTWSRTVIALNSRQHATILMSWESGVMCLYLIEILQSRLAVAHSCEKRWDLVREPDNASRNRCDATLWRDYLSGQEHSNQRQAVRMHPHQANDGGRFLFEQWEKPKN